MRASVLLVLSGVCLTLSACTIPLSENPLSNKSNSEIDERLIGTWEVDMQPVHEKLGNDGGDRFVRYRIERREEEGDELRCVYLGDEDEDKNSFPFYTTHLAMHDYFSIATQFQNDQQFYAICRYEFTGKDSGHVYLMDHPFVIEQIENGKIKGKVDHDGERIVGVRLQADGEKLQEFVVRHGEKVFDLNHPLPCKRVGPSVAEQ